MTSMLAKLFEALYVILADSIVSQLTFEFVDQMKQSLAYEINLIMQLEIKRDLGLMFDNAEVQSKLVKLLELYDQHLSGRLTDAKQPKNEEGEFKIDVSTYFSGIKPILNFFATEACMDAFAENNYKVIQRIL